MFLFNAGIKCEFFTINICFAREYENRRSLRQTDSLQLWWILIYGGAMMRREGNMGQSRGFLIQSTSLIPRIVLTAEWLKECWQCSWGGLPPPQLWTMAVETNQSVTRKQRDLRAQFKRRNIREGCRNLIFSTCNTWGHDTWYIYACSSNGRK